MLDFLRRSASSFVVKILLGLLVVSFAIWGIGDIFRAGGGGDTVVTVGKAEISGQRFRAEIGRELQRVSQILGQPITREQATAMGIDTMLLQRLVNTQIMQEGARDMGVMASDAVVLNEIKKNNEFFNEAGQFDRRIYTDVLSRAGFSEAAYVALVREGIARQQFLSPISSGAMAPQVLIDTLYKRVAETRVLDVVRITHAKLGDVAPPTDEQLAQYHEDNAARFMAPEYRSLTALVLIADDLAQGITVSPEDLATAYADRAAEYTTPEARTLSQILVKDEIAAARAAQLLDEGKSINEAAADVGANAAMIKLGVFTSAEASALSPAIAEAAFATAKGSHSQPVKSPLGWHVLVVDDIAPGTKRTLDDVKDELTRTIRNERALNVLFETSNQLDDALGSGQSLEEAATGLGLSTIKIDTVDINGQDDLGNPVTVPYADALVATAFELSAGADSSMLETADNKAFYVLRVDAVTPPALRPLDAVKTQAAAAWMQEQRAAKAEVIAAGVKARLEAGEDAQKIAQDLRQDAFTTEPFNRAGTGLKTGALPATLMNEVFSLQPGQVVSAQGTDAHTVARLKDINAAQVDAANPLYKAIHDRTLQDMQGDLAAQLSDALQDRYPVRVNQAALKELAN